MPPSSDEPTAPLLSVGRIVKPHGLRGDVIVDLTTNRPERLAEGSVLRGRDGHPYLVRSSRRHGHRFIVAFEGVTTIGDAERCRDTELLAEPIPDPEAFWVHELVGSLVFDTSGRVLGTVTEVQANPASDLLVLDGGGLVPLRFVVDRTPGERVVVDVPDGLLDR